MDLSFRTWNSQSKLLKIASKTMLYLFLKEVLKILIRLSEGFVKHKISSPI